ncbi:MAG: FAD:protein FMN transferase [Thermoplasmatota archaeon]
MIAEVTDDFTCCDTTWRIHARGARAAAAVAAARETTLELESRLNAFDPRSRVAALNRDGHVQDADVARLVARAEHYRVATKGVFDVARGALEHEIKAYIRGARETLPRDARRARWHVDGDTVVTDAPLDLNGIAKGYIVDRAYAALRRAGADGFVDGGGDIACPTGPVAIASPDADRGPIGTLDTRWNVATSGNSKRRRGAVDHLYDPRDGRVGSRHTQVTVVAERDCTEADVLATTLAVLPLEEGYDLVARWPGVEALWVDGEALFASEGFEDHVSTTA